MIIKEETTDQIEDLRLKLRLLVIDIENHTDIHPNSVASIITNLNFLVNLLEEYLK